MGERLAGKVAVVVGGGQTPGETIGNGRATALLFAREGAQVLVVDRDGDRAEATVDEIAGQGGEAVAHRADVAADDGPASVVAAARSAFGRIDVLHNNVGIGAGDAPPHHLTDEAYDRIMDVNLRATWRTCREAVPALRETQGARSSTSPRSPPSPSAGNLTAYKLSEGRRERPHPEPGPDQRQARRPGQRDHARLHRHPDGRRRPGRAARASSGPTTPRSGPTTSPSAGRAPPGTWPTPPCSWPPTRPGSSPAWSWPSTAARAPSSAEVRPGRGR